MKFFSVEFHRNCRFDSAGTIFDGEVPHARQIVKRALDGECVFAGSTFGDPVPDVYRFALRIGASEIEYMICRSGSCLSYEQFYGIIL